jgi:hypothetical protein
MKPAAVSAPTPAGPDSARRPRRLARGALAGAVVLVLAALLWALFLAYQRPGFLLELVNLRYCG